MTFGGKLFYISKKITHCRAMQKIMRIKLCMFRFMHKNMRIKLCIFANVNN